jgi:hypothetical protein
MVAALVSTNQRYGGIGGSVLLSALQTPFKFMAPGFFGLDNINTTATNPPEAGGSVIGSRWETLHSPMPRLSFQQLQ